MLRHFLLVAIAILNPTTVSATADTVAAGEPRDASIESARCFKSCKGPSAKD
jgi:hypothetical protein